LSPKFCDTLSAKASALWVIEFVKVLPSCFVLPTVWYVIANLCSFPDGFQTEDSTCGKYLSLNN